MNKMHGAANKMLLVDAGSMKDLISTLSFLGSCIRLAVLRFMLQFNTLISLLVLSSVSFLLLLDQITISYTYMCLKELIICKYFKIFLLDN